MNRGELHLGSVPVVQTEPGEAGDHEVGVRRPYLIVSRISDPKTIVACPLSTSAKSEGRLSAVRIVIVPEDVQATPNDHPYQWKAGVILVDQIRVMSRKRFAMKSGTSRIGRLSGQKMGEVEDALYVLLGLEP